MRLRLRPALLLVALLPLARPDPLPTSFSSCLPSASRAPQDQLISFGSLYSQLRPSSSATSLALALFGRVSSQAQGLSNQTNLLATIIAEASVLSFQAAFNQSSLCSAIRNPSSSPSSSGCPYGPGDLALGLSLPLSSSYAFTSISTQLRLLDSSTPPLTLACLQFVSSPFNADFFPYALLRWLPLALLLTFLLFSSLARLWASFVSVQLNHEALLASALVHSLPSSAFARLAEVWWQSWSGQGLLYSGALLRFATPCVRDLLWHLQFLSLLALIPVHWPEFAYPVLAQSAWSLLAFNSSLLLPSSSPAPSPLSTPPYAPPQNFAALLDSPDSPLYLNRSIPNSILNFNHTLPGLPRWALVVGIDPSDLFPTSIILFAILCVLVILFSLGVFLITLATSPALRLLGRTPSPPPCPASPASLHQTPALSAPLRLHPSSPAGDPSSSPNTASQPCRPSLRPPPHTCQKIISFDDPTHHLLLPPSPPALGPSWRPHGAMLQGNLLRLLIFFHTPIILFSSHQLTLTRTASTSTVALAAVCLLLSVLLPTFQLLRLKRLTPDELLGNPFVALALGPMYNTFANRNEMFMGIRFVGALVVGIVVGTGASLPIVQAVVVLLVELFEALVTSLWVPWGEGAAMAPLAFVFSASRIISALILVVLTPTVNVGPAVAGWLTYISLVLHGFIFVILLLVLLVKITELLLRILAHIPFDETRSTTAGGLLGAVARWDRTTNRSTRRGKAAAIAAHRRRRHPRSLPPSEPDKSVVPMASSRFAVDGNHRASVSPSLNLSPPTPAKRNEFAGGPQPSHLVPLPPSGFSALNDDEGNIMSAMSQGAWLRASPHDPTPTHPHHLTPSNQVQHQPLPHSTGPAPQPSTYPVTTEQLPTSGFAVVRGGRATEKAPYLVHGDGKRQWHSAPRPQQGRWDYPPLSPLAQMNLPVGYPNIHSAGTLMERDKTTTNLFENSGPQKPMLDSQSDPAKHLQSISEVKRKRRRRRERGKAFMSFWKSKGPHSRQGSPSEEDDDWDDEDSDETESESESEEEEEEEGEKKGVQSRTSKRMKQMFQGLGTGWMAPRKVDQHQSSSSGSGSGTGTEPTGAGHPSAGGLVSGDNPTALGQSSGGGKGFEVVRQPRPRPSPLESSLHAHRVQNKLPPAPSQGSGGDVPEGDGL